MSVRVIMEKGGEYCHATTLGKRDKLESQGWQSIVHIIGGNMSVSYPDRETYVNFTNGLDIKIARLKAGLRQYDLAASLGISPSQLSEIESGRRKPSPETGRRLFQIIASPAGGEPWARRAEERETLLDELSEVKHGSSN